MEYSIEAMSAKRPVAAKRLAATDRMTVLGTMKFGLESPPEGIPGDFPKAIT
jgi:hypothetical protein